MDGKYHLEHYSFTKFFYKSVPTVQLNQQTSCLALFWHIQKRWLKKKKKKAENFNLNYLLPRLSVLE